MVYLVKMENKDNELDLLLIEAKKVNTGSSIIAKLLIYFKKHSKQSIENSLLMHVAKDDSHAMVFLGYYYDEQKDYKNMEKYYLMAIEKGNSIAMNNLGYYYYNKPKNYKNMEKYYLMAIEKGDSLAMNNLGYYYYREQKDYKNMEKYYLMAIEKNNSVAMYNFGLYYEEQKDYVLALKYFNMYIEYETDENERKVALQKIKNIISHNSEIIFIFIKSLLNDNKEKDKRIEELQRFIDHLKVCPHPDFKAAEQDYLLSRQLESLF
jgi:TPR repeat protein